MSENSMLDAVKNCLMRRPKAWMAFSLASSTFKYLLSNTGLWAGYFGNDIPQKQLCTSGTQTRFMCISVQALQKYFLLHTPPHPSVLSQDTNTRSFYLIYEGGGAGYPQTMKECICPVILKYHLNTTQKLLMSDSN